MPGTVYPSDAPRPTDSLAEKTVWKALKARLPDGWTAWHSLKLRDDHGYLGEGDFILAHPQRGLLYLEVKGGQIKQEGGHWYSSGTRLEKAPLSQALTYLGKLLKRLDAMGCQPPAFGAAVTFPETDFEVQPDQDDLKGVVMGGNHLLWLAESLPAVVRRAVPHPEPGAGRGEWVKRLHKLWGDTWLPTLSLGARVTMGEERRLSLDEFQLFALDALSEQERALVQGGAGTGKTLIAAEAARRAAADGKKVLLLCFTQPLRKWLASRLAVHGVEVQTVSGLAKQVAEAVDGAWAAKDLTDSELWRQYYERAIDCVEPRWDVVLVDEAQDFTYEAWFFVKTLAEGRRLWAFWDPGQGFWRNRVPPEGLFPPPFKLTRGQRCPKGIEALAERALGRPTDEAAIKKAVADETIAVVPCPSGQTVTAVVGALVDKLVAQGVRPADIGVVSLRGQKAAGSLHRQAKLGKHAVVQADADDMEERLVADSFLRWKGLERPVMIIADLPEGDLSGLDTRLHIALTRALTAVRIVAPAGHPALTRLGL